MKIFTGQVISTKMSKTATVAVERIVVHPMYKKRLKRIKKYHVHDELGVKVGDKVSFTACKPVSKLKKWKIIEVINEKKKEIKKPVSKKGKKK
jgi:small subunit ribosomal protein S17